MSTDAKVTTFADAFERLSEGLISNKESIEVGSFYDFIVNVWSLSFEHTE